MEKPKLTKFGTELRELYKKHIDGGTSPRLLGLEMCAAATATLSMDPIMRAIVHGFAVSAARAGGDVTDEEQSYMAEVSPEGLTVERVIVEPGPAAKKGAALN